MTRQRQHHVAMLSGRYREPWRANHQRCVEASTSRTRTYRPELTRLPYQLEGHPLAVAESSPNKQRSPRWNRMSAHRRSTQNRPAADTQRCHPLTSAECRMHEFSQDCSCADQGFVCSNVESDCDGPAAKRQHRVASRVVESVPPARPHSRGAQALCTTQRLR